MTSVSNRLEIDNQLYKTCGGLLMLLITSKVICFCILALRQSPRPRVAVLSEKAIKLFNVSKSEVERAKRLGRRLLPLPNKPAGKRSEGL